MRLLNIIDQALWFRLRDLAIPLSKSKVQIVVAVFKNVNGRRSFRSLRRLRRFLWRRRTPAQQKWIGAICV